MKKLLLILALVMAFGFTAMAQETTTQSTSTTTTKTKKAKAGKSAAKEHAVTGCLSAGTAPDTWTLTKGKKTWTVSGQDLSQHVGHEVKLTGMMENGQFKVSNVEHIADTCTTAKAGKMKKEKKGGAAATPPGF